MHCGKYGHRTDNCKVDCDKPECAGLFRWPKHAPACPLNNPANLKRPADAPHRAQEADDDDISEADAREAEESYLPSSDGVNSMHVEQFFDARETPSKHGFFDARECARISISVGKGIQKEAQAQADRSS